ncbi:hypothetical protein BGX26_003263, partial [Mortierella sp. AD094]
PSPALVRTESLESTLDLYTVAEKDPFHVHDDEDEDVDEDSTHADADEDNDILLPDNTDQGVRFSAVLDEIDVALGFRKLFTDLKKKSVFIHDVDQALARSGIVFLDKEGTEIQKLYFGAETVAQMREKSLEKWQDKDAAAARNKMRTWLDPLEDYGYDRKKSRKHLFDNPPLDGEDDKLWTYILTAIQEFPQSDCTKSYSESTSISSFILPLCRVFMGMPDQRMFLNFVDSTTTSGRLRSGSRSRKEPDLALEIKDGHNKTVCEVGVGK